MAANHHLPEHWTKKSLLAKVCSGITLDHVHALAAYSVIVLARRKRIGVAVSARKVGG
jgi:hypothetical protein